MRRVASPESNLLYGSNTNTFCRMSSNKTIITIDLLSVSAYCECLQYVTLPMGCISSENQHNVNFAHSVL